MKGGLNQPPPAPQGTAIVDFRLIYWLPFTFSPFINLLGKAKRIGTLSKEQMLLEVLLILIVFHFLCYKNNSSQIFEKHTKTFLMHQLRDLNTMHNEQSIVIALSLYYSTPGCVYLVFYQLHVLHQLTGLDLSGFPWSWEISSWVLIQGLHMEKLSLIRRFMFVCFVSFVWGSWGRNSGRN